MKLALVQTTSSYYREKPFYFLHRVLEPLGIEYIGAYAKEHGHDIEIIDQVAATNDDVIQRIAIYKPDLVGFSVMTYSYPDACEIAQRIKRDYPEIKTLLGGYHALGMTACPSYFDYVIVGEGEIAVAQLIAELKSGSDGNLTKVPGLKFVHGTNFEPYRRHNWGFPSQKPDFYPLRDGYGINRELYVSQNMGDNIPGTKIACVVVGRGCPYHCDFCLTPLVQNGHSRSIRGMQHVIREIRYLVETLKINSVNIRDESFQPRRLVLDFANRLIQTGLKIRWRCFLTVGCLKPEDYKILAASGCSMVFIGIEASDADTIYRLKKNIKFDQIEWTVKAAQEAGIFVRAGFIVGHENETPKSLERHADFLKKICPDEINVSYLTPFPGTDFYNRIKANHSLLTDDLRLYDCNNPIFKPENLSKESLMTCRTDLIRSFYHSKEWGEHMKGRLSGPPQQAESVRRFGKHLADVLDGINPIENL